MDTTFTIRYLDHLPKIPEHLIQNLEQYQQNTCTRLTSQTQYGGLDTDNDPVTEQLDPNKFYSFGINGELKQWLLENIFPCPVDTSVYFYGPRTETLNSDRSRFTHVDITRDMSLLYLTDPGGPDVRTVFYKHKDYPLFFEPGIVPWAHNFDPNDMHVVDDVCIEPKRWVLLNGRIIHKVTGIYTFRVNIQLSLNVEHYDQLMSNQGELSGLLPTSS